MTEERIMLSIANDFSDAPGARYRSDGPDSGEAFYQDKLKPRFIEAAKLGCTLEVDLDGTYGYATSFISESFGTLSKEFGAKRVFATLSLKSEEDPELLEYVKLIIRSPEHSYS